jgi:hypothetical protein
MLRRLPQEVAAMRARIALPVLALAVALTDPLAAQRPHALAVGALVRIVSAREGPVAEGVLVRLAPDTVVLSVGGSEQAFPLGGDRRLEVGFHRSRLGVLTTGAALGLVTGLFTTRGGYAALAIVPVGAAAGLFAGAVTGGIEWLPSQR